MTIRLESFNKKDIIHLNKILSNVDTVKFLPIEPHKSIKDTENFYNKLVNSSKSIIWKILIDIDDRSEMVGIIDLTGISKCKANLAYVIDSQYTGNGIATFVIKEVINIAFNEMGLKKIIAPVASRNISSKRVLEKNNFVFTEFGIKDIFFDGSKDQVIIYCLENE
ncbi:MAG: GNAT family N-acetyltransferase [Spirochaetaceae bacterium]